MTQRKTAPDITLASPFGSALLLSLLLTSCAQNRVLVPESTPQPSPPETAREKPESVTDLQRITVTTTADSGKGSLRQAIVEANEQFGPNIIGFDVEGDLFQRPQTITLTSPLPALNDEVVIDGRETAILWKASGVTVDGGGRFPVFTVGETGRATLSALTIANGLAENGGGVRNRGNLVLKDCTLLDNKATVEGGGLYNEGGTAQVINSTFFGNVSKRRGGGLSNDRGRVTVTNSTFAENESTQGGALFSDGSLLLRNTILADSGETDDCFNAGILDGASRNNLIERHTGCGVPISNADPKFGRLAYYNGPMKTLPVGGGSAAVNLGDNASAVDERGEPLRWDQRGNGDPRFVAGITDIGAFEKQGFPNMIVDMVDDSELRGCSGAPRDCSLRGAIQLANAWGENVPIRFDPRVFTTPQVIRLERDLPTITVDLHIDGSDTGGVTVDGSNRYRAFESADGINVTVSGVQIKAGGGK